jgi:regulator of sigma E protease
MLDALGNGVWAAVWFIVAVSVLVTVHEFGHFWVARRLGFKVLRFSVGFGPAIWRSKPDKHGTEFVLASIPLGGYVKLLDEREAPVPPEDRARAFNQRPPWQRILVLLAGPGINILFAVLLLWIVLAVSGRTEWRAVVGQVRADSVAAAAGLARGDTIVAINDDAVSGRSSAMVALIEAMSDDGDVRMSVLTESGARRERLLHVPDSGKRIAMTEPENMPDRAGFLFVGPPAILAGVISGGPAAAAGLRAGDEILAVDDLPMADREQFVARVRSAPGATLNVSYRRAGETFTTQMQVLAEQEDGATTGKIRVEFAKPSAEWIASMAVPSSYSLAGALGASVKECWHMTVLQASMLWKMLTGRVSVKNLSGPITIAEVAGQSARGGLQAFVSMLVLISLSLGFLNLLPIPILDGGQVLYQLAEWLKGSPLSERAQAVGQQIGIALLVLLMGVAFFNDIVRQIQPG